MKIRFNKYHGLGNDYVVIDTERDLNSAEIQTLCHRNYGIGADGILIRVASEEHADFALKIFNPDGSEAEKSGNGLRIFARYLADRGLVGEQPFSIQTKGGVVTAHLLPASGLISVSMGQAQFVQRDLLLPLGEGQQLGQVVSLGNPHCVLFMDVVSAEIAHKYGASIENDSHFPNRTNVQFAHVLDRNNLRIEIWERGAGYTLASGSSSCAAVAAAYWLGYCAPQVCVHMPGGTLDIAIDADNYVTMVGPVVKVAHGVVAGELFGRNPTT